MTKPQAAQERQAQKGGRMIDPHKILKCRFCNWTTPRWTTSLKGNKIYAFNWLLFHVQMKHPKEYDEIMRYAYEEYPD